MSDQLAKLNQEWNRAMSEFAAGSEFIDDPKRTAEHIKKSRELQSLLAAKKNERLEAQLAEAIRNADKQIHDLEDRLLARSNERDQTCEQRDKVVGLLKQVLHNPVGPLVDEIQSTLAALEKERG